MLNTESILSFLLSVGFCLLNEFSGFSILYPVLLVLSYSLLDLKQLFSCGSGTEHNSVNLFCNISIGLKWSVENFPTALIALIKNFVLSDQSLQQSHQIAVRLK